MLCHAPGKWVGQLQWVWQLFIWIFIHGFYNFETKNHVRRPGYGGPEKRRLDDSNNRWLTLRSVIYNLLMPPSVMLKSSGILMSHVLIIVISGEKWRNLRFLANECPCICSTRVESVSAPECRDRTCITKRDPWRTWRRRGDGKHQTHFLLHHKWLDSAQNRKHFIITVWIWVDLASIKGFFRIFNLFKTSEHKITVNQHYKWA